MANAKITTVGSSSGIVLPKELLKKWQLEKGDMVSIVETDKGIEISPFDVEFEEQMNAAREVMRKNRNALRELAK